MNAAQPNAAGEFCRWQTLLYLWVVVLGPPVLWLVQFQIIYSAVSWACMTGRTEIFPFTSGASGLLAVLLAWMGVELGQGLRRTAEDEVHERTRFMLKLGLMLSGLFALLIAAQGVAILFVGPCQH